MNFNVPIGNQERKEIHKEDEESLVASAKEGDERAFAALWTRHSKIVLRKAVRITRNYADAEDAVQDAFFRAFVRLKSFDKIQILDLGDEVFHNRFHAVIAIESRGASRHLAARRAQRDPPSNACISSAGNGRRRSSGGLAGSESGSSQR